MSKRAMDGRVKRPSEAQAADAAIEAPQLSPLDFMLQVVRDESQPAALRLSAAKAALPYLHKRDEEEAAPEEPAAEDKPLMSDLELARRIAHILVRADAESAPV